MARYRNPLEPAASSVHILFAITVTLLSLGVIATMFGSGSLFGFGNAIACVDVRNGAVQVPQSGSNIVLGTVDGVTSSASTVGLCRSSPTSKQRILEALADWPTFLVFLGALLLAMRLIRSATRHGIFTERTTKRLRALGWFVLVGELAATLIEALARLWLTNTMMSTPLPATMWLGEWNVPVLALFLGAVFVSMARIMRISTAMREDLEGTV